MSETVEFTPDSDTELTITMNFISEALTYSLQQQGELEENQFIDIISLEIRDGDLKAMARAYEIADENRVLN